MRTQNIIEFTTKKRLKIDDNLFVQLRPYENPHPYDQVHRATSILDFADSLGNTVRIPNGFVLYHMLNGNPTTEMSLSHDITPPFAEHYHYFLWHKNSYMMKYKDRQYMLQIRKYWESCADWEDI